MEKKKYYAGIGSRKTPPDALKFIEKISRQLEKNYILRSGGASGADKAFEKNVQNKEIFLPWKNFNGSESRLYTIPKEAFAIAEQFHKGWKYLKTPVKKLMARNVQQVLGTNLKNPAEFVVCWTLDGCEESSTRTSKTGGTGLAIDLAYSNNIPVYDLRNKESIEKILKIINEGNVKNAKNGKNEK